MRAWVSVTLLAIVAAVAALLALEALFGVVLAQVVFLVILLVATMGLGVVLRPERQLPLLCDPFLLYCAFLAQFYVAGPIIMGIWGLSPIVFFRAPGIEDTVEPLLGCILLVSCSVVGYRFGLGHLIASRLPDFSATAGKFERRWVVAAMVGVGGAGCLWWIQYQGGLLAKLGIGYGGGKPGAAFALVFNVLLLGTILWAWLIFDKRSATRAEVGAFVTVLVLEAVFFGIVYGVRKYLFFLFFSILACWLLRRGVRSLPKARTAAILAALLVFFAVWGAVRDTPVAAMLGFGETRYNVRQRDFREGYFSGVADPFGSATLVWQVFPDQEPFRHGGTLLVTVLGFIPRAVWPEKPVGIGKELTRYYVGPYYEPTEGYSVTPTLPADLYLNFGWLGVALGGFLLGVMCRTTAAYAVRDMVGGLQTRAARVLVPALVLIGLGEVRADMAQMLAIWSMTGVPLLFALLFFRMDGRPTALPAPPVRAVPFPAP